MKLYYLLLIFLLTEKLFYLLPWVDMHNPLVDLGNVLVWIGLADSVFRSKHLSVLNNSISVMVLVYLFIIGIQMALAMFYYGQGIVGGLIGARQQLYYLSFFLFLLSLDDTKKIVRFLEMLSVTGIIVFLLALINYFGPNIFYARDVEGVGIRSGIVRAWFPAMMLMSFVGLWQICRCLDKETLTKKSMNSMVLLLAAHIFRQTRTRTITLIFILGCILMLKRKLKHAAAFVFAGALAVIGAQIFMEENIFISPIESAIEELSEDSGTWNARTDLARSQLARFWKFPILGDGQVALAGSMGEQQDNVVGKTRQLIKSSNVHAGYSSWVLSYGLVGAIWLICFICSLLVMGSRALRHTAGEENVLITFGMSYICFVTITTVSLNHLQYPDGILYACLAAAIIVRTIWNLENTKNEASSDHPNARRV